MVALSDETAPWWKTDADKLEELRAAIKAHAPRLRLVVGDEELVARGTYSLTDSGGEALDTYAIEIRYDRRDPASEPKVKEIGNAIDPVMDNHINPVDQTCCVGVYNEWEALTNDTSFAGFLGGPVRNFFISQTIFRRKGIWIFDQRKHGLEGMVDAYGELLGDPAPTAESVGRTLSFLALPTHKGHWPCPCPSRKRYRHCCRARLSPAPLPQVVAAKLFARLSAEVAKVHGKAAAAKLNYGKQ